MKLGVRFNLTVACATIAIMGASGTWNAIQRSATLKSELIKTSEVTSARLANSAGKALWDMDEKTLELATRTEMQDERIASAAVYDSGNKIVLHLVRDGNDIKVEKTDPNTNAELITHERAIDFEKDDKKSTLGKIFLAYSQSKLKSEIRSQVITSILETAFLTAIILVTVATALTRTVLNPIERSTALISKFSNGDFDVKISENDVRGNDEVSTMMRMLATLRSFLLQRAGDAQSLAKGDLSIIVQATSERDIMGQEFSKMVASLSEKVKTIRACTQQVFDEGNQISRATQELSQSSVRQAAALEEISSTLTEINSRTKENSNNAADLAKRSQETSESAGKGNERAKLLKQAFQEITNSGKKVSGIVKVIDDIAFQTNLLALNASVEAARAGKHGKGFAVVADEVRNLASRSAAAVAETAAVIENMNRSTESGTVLSAKLASDIDAILNGTKAVDTIAHNVAVASEQQSSSISQVLTGINQIENDVQQSAAATEQVSSTTQMLKDEMSKLSESVAVFQT